MTTTSSPTASRTAAMARRVMPSVLSAAEPVASLSSGLRQRKQDHPGDTQAGQAADLVDQGRDRVLDDAGHRGHRPRGVEAVGDEQRGDQVVDGERRLGHQAPEGRRAAQAAEAAAREAG